MAIKMDNYGNVYDDELFHHGVKGMKWGKNIMAGKNVNNEPGSWWKNSKPSGGFYGRYPYNGPVEKSPYKGNIAQRTNYMAGDRKYGVSTSIGNMTRKAVGAMQGRKPDPFRPKRTGRSPGNAVYKSNRQRAMVNGARKAASNARTIVQTGNRLRKGPNESTLDAVFNESWFAKNHTLKHKVGDTIKQPIAKIQKEQSGLLYKAKKTVNRIFKKISKFFGW